MNKLIMTVVAGGLALGAFASGNAGRDNFMMQQAIAEGQRISGQVDRLQSNFDDLAERVTRLERASGAKGETEALRAEIASLKTQIVQLKRDLEAQRGKIVSDLTKNISTLQKQMPTQPPPQKKPAYTGPYREYKVEAGDNLSIIAQATDTTVAKIREVNNLKNDNLRAGQVLKIPCK